MDTHCFARRRGANTYEAFAVPEAAVALTADETLSKKRGFCLRRKLFIRNVIAYARISKHKPPFAGGLKLLFLGAFFGFKAFVYTHFFVERQRGESRVFKFGFGIATVFFKQGKASYRVEDIKP